MELAVRNQALTQRVGAIAIGVVSVLAVLVVLLDNYTWRSSFHAKVYYQHMSGLHEGADVQVAGQVIGEIIDISLLPGHLIAPEHVLSPTGGVAVTIRIEDRYRHMAPINGEYFVSVKGLIGQRYIEIGAPPNHQPYARLLREGDQVRGIDLPQTDRVLRRMQHNFKMATSFAEAIKPQARQWLDAMSDLADTLAGFDTSSNGPGEPELGDTGTLLRKLATQARTLSAKWQAGNVRAQDIEALAQKADAVSTRITAEIADTRARVDNVMTEIAKRQEQLPDDLRSRLEHTLATLDQSLAKIQQMTAHARELADVLNRGEGTALRLLLDPEFPEDAKQLGRMIKRHPWRLIGRHQRK